MMRWLSVVGIGEDGLDGIGAAAKAAIVGAELLVGDARTLALVPTDARPRLTWPRPLAAAIPEIAAHRGQPVCVLASGDPMNFGVGVLLARHFGAEELSVHPAPSAFSLACARLGWGLADVTTLSVHSRPVETVLGKLAPGRRLLLLTRDGTTPAAIAALLHDRGWGASRLVALERMGSPAEGRVVSTADEWPAAPVDDLNVLAIECTAGPDALPLSTAPGLPDAVFDSDGMLTKREVRAVTLAALAPLDGQVLWDVGAGCGSIALEWLRLAPAGRAFAVEAHASRRELIATNAKTLGVAGLTVVAGRAPEALAALPRPDTIFIGGGLTAPGLIDACWEALPAAGRLVANAVTTEGETAMLERRASWGGELTRIAVWRDKPVGRMTGWQGLMPVTIWSVVKP
jgi:precorrin-6Y C5,15-methyltransferase (decarboxylating)